jgi:c-di-GMP-binding flagellar brake protein YcgR
VETIEVTQNQIVCLDWSSHGEVVTLRGVVSHIEPRTLKILVSNAQEAKLPSGGARVRVRFWDEIQAYFFDTRVSDVTSQRRDFVVTVPRSEAITPVQRREFFRVNERVAFSFRVQYATDPPSLGPPRYGQTKDISGGGLGFLCVDPPPVGTTLRLSIPVEPGRHIVLNGRIVRVQSSRLGEFCGVHFIVSNESKRDALVAMVFELQRRKRAPNL